MSELNQTAYARKKSAVIEPSLADALPPHHPVVAIDQQISTGTPAEAAKWLAVRGQLLQQDEAFADHQHQRSMDRFGRIAQVALSFGALATGVGLVVSGFALPGFVCIGASLYPLAPRFIDRVTDSMFGKKKR